MPSSTLKTATSPTKIVKEESENEFPSFEEWKIQKQQENAEQAETLSLAVQKSSYSQPSSQIGNDSLANNDVPSARFNYASVDCAAKILLTNSDAKSASSVLVEDKDRYMLNKCSTEDKFIIVELCADILIDRIALANFEVFSSTFRQFKVSVTDRYPPKEDSAWKVLGIFEAKNSRDLQYFHVNDVKIWSRHVRFEFLSHYGNSRLCPLSVLRVHGTTMMDEYKSGSTKELDEVTSESSVVVAQSLDELYEGEPRLVFNLSLSHLEPGWPPNACPNPTTSFMQYILIPSPTCPTSAVNSSEPQPTTGLANVNPGQENIFKSIANRLNLLERNATLSIRYIEEQSRILREALTKIEKRSDAKVDAFLDTVNRTIHSQISAYRNQYERIFDAASEDVKYSRLQSNLLQSQIIIMRRELAAQRHVLFFNFLVLLLLFAIILLRSGLSWPNLKYDTNSLSPVRRETPPSSSPPPLLSIRRGSFLDTLSPSHSAKRRRLLFQASLSCPPSPSPSSPYAQPPPMSNVSTGEPPSTFSLSYPFDDDNSPMYSSSRRTISTATL